MLPHHLTKYSILWFQSFMVFFFKMILQVLLTLGQQSAHLTTWFVFNLKTSKDILTKLNLVPRIAMHTCALPKSEHNWTAVPDSLSTRLQFARLFPIFPLPPQEQIWGVYFDGCQRTAQKRHKRRTINCVQVFLTEFILPKYGLTFIEVRFCM